MPAEGTRKAGPYAVKDQTLSEPDYLLQLSTTRENPQIYDRSQLRS
jgi:hypothetical protein